MDKKEILALRSKVESEYREKIKLLEEELTQKLEAIDIVAGLASSASDPEKRVLRRRVLTPIEKTQETNVSSAVRKAIGEIDGVFSIREIRKHVAQIDPNIEISRNVSYSVFNQLRKSGKIERVKVGKGRMPTTYKKTEDYREDNPV